MSLLGERSQSAVISKSYAGTSSVFPLYVPVPHDKFTAGPWHLASQALIYAVGMSVLVDTPMVCCMSAHMLAHTILGVQPLNVGMFTQVVRVSKGLASPSLVCHYGSQLHGPDGRQANFTGQCVLATSGWRNCCRKHLLCCE